MSTVGTSTTDVIKNKIIGKRIKGITLIQSKFKEMYDVYITANTSLYSYSGFTFSHGEVIFINELDIRPGYNNCYKSHMLVVTDILPKDITAQMKSLFDKAEVLPAGTTT